MRLQQFLIESINDKGILKSVMLSGMPAAGKTTIVKQVITDGTYPIKVINTDKWTEHFKGDYANNRTTIKKLSKTDYINTLNSLLPLYLDTTSGNLSIFKKRTDELKRFGYDIKMIFADIDVETAIERVKVRNKKIKRQVDVEFIRQKFDTFYGGKEQTSIVDTQFYKKISSILGEKPIVVNTKDLSWNKATKKVYNTVTKYLNSPIKNKRGQVLVDYMKKDGYKYYREVPEQWLIDNGYPLLSEITYY
jgi:predicted ABC-type ATPase